MPPWGVDVLLGALLLVGAWSGWRHGMMAAALEVGAVASAAIIAWVTFGYPASWLSNQWPWLDVWLGALSFTAVFIFALLSLVSFGYWILRHLPKRAHRFWHNRAGGTLFGIANGVLQATVATALIGTPAAESHIGQWLAALAEPVALRLGPVFDPALRSARHLVTVPDREGASIALDYRVAAPRVRHDLEARMLDLLNGERESQGLKPLRVDPELAAVARGHCRDMFARGYFSHYAPDGASMTERLQRNDVRYRIAGENLALARSLTTAHQGLMKSPGHRANILRPQFGRVGIGVLDGGLHGLMVTQNFRD